MDEISQREKREVLRDTYLSRAQADAEIEAQGRFKRQSPTTIVGAQYPRQSSNSPWASPDPTGPEPPLGEDIEYVGALGGAKAPAAIETAPPRAGSSLSASDGPAPFLRKRRI
jgi:hypothetical protein